MKSHVSLERRRCIVCGEDYDTGSILLDRRLLPSMEMHTTTGMGLCAEHQSLHEKGYVALVAIDPTKSAPDQNGTMPFEKAHRTGPIVHMVREKCAEIFGIPLDSIKGPMIYVDEEVTNKLKELIGKQ